MFALAMAMAVDGSVLAAAPVVKKPMTPGNAKDRDKELAEATRLAEEVERLTDARRYDEAIPLAERALELRDRILGPNALDVASSLNALADLCRFKAKHVRAVALHLRALAIRETRLGSEHPAVAESLHNLAIVYALAEDYARAESLNLRALAIREKVLGPDHPAIADVLDHLANIYSAQGDYTRAFPLRQRALAIMEKVRGPDHVRVGDILLNLGNLYRRKGDYARAEPLYLRALAIYQKANHPHVGHLLESMGLLYLDKGDSARALALFQRTLAIREKVLGADHPLVANALNNLGIVYMQVEDFSQAEHLFVHALAIAEKASGPERPDTALPLLNLGRLYLVQGDYTRAEPLLLRALAIRERALGTDHPLVADSLQILADVLARKKDHARAELLYQRIMTIHEKVRGPDSAYIADLCRDMVRWFTAQGRLPEAIRAARRATYIEDRNAMAEIATGSEEQKRLYMSELVGLAHQNVSLHLQYAPASVEAARLALAAMLHRKGRVLETMADGLAVLRQSLAPADQALLDELASVYSRLATLLSRGPGGLSVEQYRKNVGTLQEQREKLEREIGQRSAAFRMEGQIVSLEDVQAAIPASAALLEIVRYEPMKFPSAEDPRPKGKPRYAAYVLRARGEPTFVDLGDAGPIESAIETLRRTLSNPDLTHDPRPAAHALDRLLMQPIRKLLGDTRWVFVSADGPVHLVPFAALVDEEDHYLVERYLFSYVNTGRDLLHFAEKPRAPREAPLVLANPAFDDSSAKPGPEATHRGLRSIDMVTQHLLPLGSTAQEARTIHELFPESRVLTGADATEEALKAAHGPRILHLATHGFFLPEQQVPEALLQAPGSEPTAEERAAILQRENPLLRSGLALAGFNRRASGIDDGVLTALEAAGLDLYGTRLVVLSACETGLGQAISGEGVYGLRRALAMAGAETQVMSLWPVDTGRTRELMQAYYQRMKAGAGRSDAMRGVQIAMLADPATSHPNLWASFIVSGDWRALEGGANLPDLTVHPGPRGCACRYGGAAGEAGEPLWITLGIGLAATLRRRSKRGVRAA